MLSSMVILFYFPKNTSSFSSLTKRLIVWGEKYSSFYHGSVFSLKTETHTMGFFFFKGCSRYNMIEYNFKDNFCQTAKKMID